MPALPPAGPVIRVQLDWTVGTDATALSRFFVAYTGTAPSTAALTTFAGLLNASCDDELPPVMHPDTSYIGCVLTDLASDTGAEYGATEDSAGSRDGGALGADG